MYFQLYFVAILSTCAAAVAAKSNLQGKRNPGTSTSTLSITGTVPIPLYDLPTLVPGSSFQADPYDVEAIRNTMSHYPLAIDGKNFAALSLVFAPDAVANYTAPLGVLTPLSTIEAALGASLAPVTTQHLLGTQVIDILSPTTAFSLTYFIATHFGVGIYYGETATAHGQYQDVWTRQPDLSWRISHRSFAYMGPLIGNVSIFTPQ